MKGYISPPSPISGEKVSDKDNPEHESIKIAGKNTMYAIILKGRL
jgi:hypothetical protein